MAVPVDLEVLLAETRWLSGLARQMVGRRHDAEDLVQETLRTAIEHPPTLERPLRGWLRTVLRSRSHDAHRSERARTMRERGSRSADAPPTVDVVVKAEVHRELVGAVLTLEEPYRTALLLRFFEDLPPRQIARQMAVPVATVHSRLQRALAMLRVRMAEARGPRWQLAFAPLLRLPQPLPSLLLGVSLVNALGKLALGAAAVAITLLVWQWPTEPAVDRTGQAAATSSPQNPVVASTGEHSASETSPVERTQVPAIPITETPASAKSPRRLRGRVIDIQGTGIAGVELAMRGGERRDPLPRLVSNLGGVFEVDAPSSVDLIVSSDTRWATVLAGSARIQTDKQSTVVVAPRLDLGGRVVDEAGTALPWAAVSVHLPSHLGAGLGILLDYSVTQVWRATCDADGRFRLPDVPAVSEASLSASLGGYLPQFAAMPGASTDLLEFVLERPRPDAKVVDGIVVDAWGACVAGARVSAGAEVSISDARGGFTIDLSKGRDLARLVAIAAGMQPAVFLPERDATGRPAWPSRLVLQLGGPPLSMQGRVLDRDGRPVAGAKVWIADPLFVGHEDDALLAETLLGRQDRVFWAFVLTDANGAFRIDGLRDRGYVVRALEPVTLAAVTREGVPAGSQQVELRFTTATFPELRGRVVARDGSAIAGVTVKLQRPALEVQVAGGTRDEWAVGSTVRTNELGAFAFANVPTEGVEVFASGDSIQFAGRMVEANIDPGAFVLQVDRRVHLQVELALPTDRADRVQVLDADGKPMLLRVMRGESAHTSRSAAIVDGRSQILSLGEGAVGALFLRGREEVGRLQLQLVIGQVNTVRF